jgi:hypothetical protein
MTTIIFVFICKTDKSKPVKQEVNGTVILPPIVFLGSVLTGQGILAEGEDSVQLTSTLR